MKIIRNKDQIAQNGPLLSVEIFDACSWIEGLYSPGFQHSNDDYDYAYMLARTNEAIKLHREGKFDEAVAESESSDQFFYLKSASMDQPVELIFRNSEIIVSDNSETYSKELFLLATALKCSLVDRFGMAIGTQRESKPFWSKFFGRKE